ncbi:PREDICTED: protein takeout [Vollenhovia emeryi]|uniref:protein takeout n=1 Tax=Vollenhovia emeryi TaxID=411798 RepID=UPI0005F3990D|nr:PREDICTED: protein takeout [Vollenhovia emeryi]
MMKTVLFLTVVLSATALELPSIIKPCARSDPKVLECVANSARDTVVSLAKGLKSFKILPLEPLEINNLEIGANDGSVALKQEYQNVKIYGLTKNLQVYDYQINWDKLIFTSRSYNPRVDFTADYKLDGRVLLLPIRGEGKCNISMHDLVSTHDIRFETFEKDGDTYMRAKKYITKFIPKHVTLNFDNLFNGQRAIGEQLTKFFADNADIIFQEFAGPYAETFGIVFTKITNDIFTRVPMSKIFK